jgi:hypothetical protein
MSDEVAVKKLDVVPTIKDGVAIGIKNIGPILVNAVLWMLTIWIPYINIGTTIGFSVGVIVMAGRGEAISMTEIFNPKYRKYMGDFFLVSGLVGIGVMVGMSIFVIPGIIIAIAWSLAILLVIDKGKNPMEAITLSYNLTNGYKLRMTGIYFIPGLIFIVVQTIQTVIFTFLGMSFINGFLTSIIMFIEILVFAGIEASIYKQLSEGV